MKHASPVQPRLSPAGVALSITCQKLHRHIDDCIRLEKAKGALRRSNREGTAPSMRELCARDVNAADTAVRVSAGHLKTAISDWDEATGKLIATASQRVIVNRPPVPTLGEDYSIPSPPAPGRERMSVETWFMEVLPELFRTAASAIRRRFSK